MEKLKHENESGSNLKGFARRSSKSNHPEKDGFPAGWLAAKAVAARDTSLIEAWVGE
jgi:hypothetical protein